MNNSNTSSFRFRSNEIDVPGDTPFANDKLNRQPFVTATVDLIKSIQEPFVISLDAPWGSGKSTTFKLLGAQLASAGVTTVSFNAWEVDYATDPLVPLIAMLHDRLREIKGFDQEQKSTTLELFKTTGGKVLKYGAMATLKAATGGLLDASEIADEYKDLVKEAVEKAGEDFTGDVIDFFKKEKQAADKFRNLLTQITNYVRASTPDGQLRPPVVLLIDELDRCRPTFSIAMLERIKHFFSIPGLVFVLALDVTQLKASTRKIYGAELDATEYLRRFIDLELKLPRAKVGVMVDSMLSNCGLDTFFSSHVSSGIGAIDRSMLVKILEDLTLVFDLSPRLIQRMITRLILVIRQLDSSHGFNSTLVAFLIFMRMRHESELRQLMIGSLSPNGILKALQKTVPHGKNLYGSETGILLEALLLHSASVRSIGRADVATSFLKSLDQMPDRNTDPESDRAHKVAEMLRQIVGSSANPRLASLSEIEARINLVSHGNY